LLSPASLHSLLIRSLVSKLYASPSLVSNLSRSPSLFSELSCSPSSPRRAVTTRIRRVSGKQSAICCCYCLYLWGVIQLLYFGNHLKLVPSLRRFLAYPSLRVLVMLPAALPRCSLYAPSTLLTPLSLYSAGHPPRSNLKSPASIFPMFPLGHRYSWAIDPQLAAHCCVPLLSTDPPVLRLSIPTVRRCQLLVAIF